MNNPIKAIPGKLRLRPRQVLSLLLPLFLFLAGWWFGLPAESGPSPSASQAGEEVWTCSMHPQIRQPNPGLCPVCEMDLIPLQDDGGGGLREVTVTPEASALLDLRVSPVRRGIATADLSLFGKLSYDERRLSTITSRIGGRLDRLFVDFTGAVVREGDHLAEIYSPEIYVAQRELIEATRAMRNQGGDGPARGTRERLLAAAREKLRLLQIPQDQIEDIAAQSEPRDRITIRSPRDGTVVSKFVEEGQYVKTGDQLLQVADLSSVWLQLEAYESDLPWLRYAQDVRFTVNALPGRTFHGRVAWIDPEIDPVRRVATVRLNVANPGRSLKPGMFARAEVRVRVTGDGKVVDPGLAGKWISPMHPEIMADEPGTCEICGMDLVPAHELGFIARDEAADHPSPLLVPASAVLRTGRRAIVYVRLPEKTAPTFTGREIILGPRLGEQFVVASGLREGELVVTRGAFKLDSELQIKAKPSMMNANAGLEERPAHDAPDELAGQWQPVLRALARLQEQARKGNGTAAAESLTFLKTAISRVESSAFLPETARLWEEFSSRLLNTLTLAGRKVSQDPETAYDMVHRSIREAARFLGLPDTPRPVPPADPALVDSLTTLLGAYFPLAEALADDDPDAARQAATALAEASDQLPLAQEAAALREAARALATTGELEAQRVAFQQLSTRLIVLIREKGLDQVGDAYVVHCPMAFDNTGADWLSDVPKVLNPYFGDRMLRCGAVTATLSLGEAPATPNDGKEGQPEHQHGQ